MNPVVPSEESSTSTPIPSAAEAPAPVAVPRPLRRPRPQTVLRWTLFQQIWRAVFEPVAFFRYLAGAQDRAWLAVMVLLLAIAGVNAVRQSTLMSNTGMESLDPLTGAPMTSAPPPLAISGGSASAPITIISGGGGGGDVVPPPSVDLGEGLVEDPNLGAPTNPADVGSTWVLGLRAGANLVLEWFILTLILSLVPMLSGRAPNTALAWRVAIWASLPLGLMSLLQWVYWGAGGSTGQAGISGLLEVWQGYMELPFISRQIVFILASKLTLFWLWSLWLVKVGARQSLKGGRLSTYLALSLWLIVQVGLALLPSLLNPPAML